MATLEDLEKIVNEQAAKLHIKYGLPRDSYYISLAPKMLEQHINLRVERGYPTAMIYIAHLPFGKEMATFGASVKSALNLIKKHHLYNCMEIVPISYYKNSRKWRMAKGELFIPDLIPKYRIKVSSVIQLKMEDTETGQYVEVFGNESSKALYDKARSLLSAKVMTQDSEEEIVNERELEKELHEDEVKQFQKYQAIDSEEEAYSIELAKQALSTLDKWAEGI